MSMKSSAEILDLIRGGWVNVVAKELPSAWIIAPEQLDHLRLPPPHLSREVYRYNLVFIFMIRSTYFQKLNPNFMRIIVIQH